MKKIPFQRGLRALGTLVTATVLSSILFAQSQGKPVRGQPIKAGGTVRGEPIKPVAPAEPAPTLPESPNAPTALVPIPPPAPVSVGGYKTLGFDILAGFNYNVPEYAGTNKPVSPDTNQIPVAVKAFDGQPVALKGFMLPLKVEQGKVTELLLMRDQSMCCFGSVPKINEFITVKMVGGGTKAVMDQAVTLFGRLRVGEFLENGYLLGIYQLDGDKAEGPGL